jgi:hypothetical protein
VHRRSAIRAIGLGLALALTTATTVTAQADPSESPAPAVSLPAGPTITVTGVEYRFEGLPSSAPVGTTLELVNGGAEVHELVVYRKNDGVTESFEELLQLPDDEALTKVTMIGGLFAGPGQPAEGSFQLPQEGEYIALCFVPQGLTAIPTGGPDSTAVPEGTPHFLLGMVQTFAVTAAGSSPGPLPTAAPAPPASVAPEASPAA